MLVELYGVVWPRSHL